MTDTTVEAVEDTVTASSAKYNFDLDFQVKIAGLVARDTVFCQMTEGLIKPEYFEDPGCAAIVKVALRYFDRYRMAPGDRTTLIDATRNAINDKIVPAEAKAAMLLAFKEVLAVDVSQRDYVADQISAFARHQAVAQAILDSVELVQRGDFELIDKSMRDALNVGRQSATPLGDYGAELEGRTEERKKSVAGVAPPQGITTGFPQLDAYLYHKGWGRRELSVLMGPAKSGKSMGLLTFAVMAAYHQYSVLYVTLEVSKQIICDRIDAQIANRQMVELADCAEEVQLRVQDYLGKAKHIRILEEPMGTLKVSELRRKLQQYKAAGITFDLVVIDYGDIMAPEHRSEVARENSTQIFIDLRALALQEDIAILTATQTNRDGAKKMVAAATDVAEDFNKVRVADILLSINRTDEEKAAGRARLFIAASRNSQDGITIALEQDFSKAKFVTRVLGSE